MRCLAGTSAVLWVSFATAGCTGLESSADTFCTFNSCPPAPLTQADAGATDASAAAAPDAPKGPWWCEANGVAMTPVHLAPTPTPRPTKVRYRLPIIDFRSAIASNPMPVLDVTIMACPNGDPGCTIDGGSIAPFAVIPPPLVTTPPSPLAAFTYQIELPYNFDGSIRITATGYVPLEYFLGGPLVATVGATFDPDGALVVTGLFVTPTSEVALDPFYAGVGVVRDKSKGLLGARLVDCNGARAQGVLINVMNPTGTGYTLRDNQPVFTDPLLPTDSRAVSGYLNMDPHNYQVSGITPAGGHYGSTVAPIVQDTLTVLEIRTDTGHLVGR